jgi:hypothetical protein
MPMYRICEVFSLFMRMDGRWRTIMKRIVTTDHDWRYTPSRSSNTLAILRETYPNQANLRDARESVALPTCTGSRSRNRAHLVMERQHCS